MQVQYQRGILYRLRTLGESHDMRITVDGFQSYMFKGLSFILPFLAIAYVPSALPPPALPIPPTLAATPVAPNLQRIPPLLHLQDDGLRGVAGCSSGQGRGGDGERESDSDGQVIALGLLFLVLAVGNMWTTGAVVYRKYADQKQKEVASRVRKYSSVTSPKQD